MAYTDAFELCKRKRPVAQPIASFVDQCKKYEQKCRKLGVLQSGDSSKKKKRKMVGPSIGPAIGPTIGPSIGPEPPSAVPQKRSTAETPPEAAIGPAFAGDIGVAEQVEDGDDDGDGGDDCKRESKKAKIIGPALPLGAEK